MSGSLVAGLGVGLARGVSLGFCGGRIANTGARGRLGGPAGKEVQGLLGCAVWFDGVGDDGQPGVAGEGEGFASEFKLPDDGVVHHLGGGAMEADVVAGPPSSELLAAGGQLADEVSQGSVVGVAAGLDAER